jgi:hypothetical protein
MKIRIVPRGPLVGLLATVVLSAMAAGETAPPPAAALSTAEVDRAFAGFDAWLEGHLARAAASPGDDAHASLETAGGVTLARERRRALRQLAHTDPRQALARALPASVLARLPLAVREESEEYVDACGAAFDFEIADDYTSPDAPVSRVTRTLTVADRTYEARVFGRRLGTTSRAIHANGIALEGMVVLYESPLRRMDDAEAAADATVKARCGAPGPRCLAVKVGAQTLVFRNEAALERHRAALERDEHTVGRQHPAGRSEALDPLAGLEEGNITVASAWTTGEKTVLYIRVDTSDRPGDPVAADVAQSTLDGAVNTYYRETSYDKTSLRATVTPTLRLPRTAADYEANGDSPILSDGRAAALAAGFNTANYNLYIVAFPRMSFSYSGKARVGAAGVWLNGSFGSSVTAHELGHNYGLHHANFWQTTDGTVIGAGANVEYGNVFDVMGRGGVRGQFNAWFKSRLDWLLPADYTTVAADGTFRIEPIDDPVATGARALKIVKDATRNYWVEFRQLFTTNRWASNGAMLNWGYNNNAGSHLLDTTPGSANSQNDAPLLVGRTFSDTVSGIHITAVSRTASPPAMDVVVKRGSFPGNAPPAATLTASSLSVPRNTAVTFTVSASDLNGDSLAYGWEFDDGTLAPNQAVVARSWSSTGSKLVRCVVSDMVGGLTATSITVTVTSSGATYSISGTVTSRGAGVPGVVVSDGARSATTNGAGVYTITGVPNGTYTLTPRLNGVTFNPTRRRVTVNGANVTGRDFRAPPRLRPL